MSWFDLEQQSNASNLGALGQSVATPAAPATPKGVFGQLDANVLAQAAAANQVTPFLSPVTGTSLYAPSYDQTPTSATATDPNGNHFTPSPQPASTPDLSTHEGQLAWVQQQLAGTKYATDDPNYWLGRINDTGGFTPDNLSYWGTNIKKEWWGSPQQVAGEAANNGGVNQPFSYAKPDVPAFAYTPFTAPTAADAANAPGFQATVDTADKGLLRQRAALGSLLTGGTLQDLSTLNSGLGAQNYQNIYNNAAQANALNNAGYLQQHNTSLSDYEQGLQNALGIYGTNQAVNQQAFNNAFQLGTTGFNQQLSLAQLGLDAAGGANAAGSAYGNAAGNLYTGIGNANAAGTVGGANAYGSALNNLGNFGLTYASLYGLNKNKNAA